MDYVLHGTLCSTPALGSEIESLEGYISMFTFMGMKQCKSKGKFIQLADMLTLKITMHYCKKTTLN